MLLFYFCIAIIVIACILDYRISKVSNVLIILGYLSSLIFQVGQAKWRGLQVWGVGLALPILLLFLLFYFKMLGAGDIKLFSVIGSFYGPKVAVDVIVSAILAGGVISCISLLRNRNSKERFLYFLSYTNQIRLFRKRIPYIRKEDKGKPYTLHFTICILIGFMATRVMGYV